MERCKHGMTTEYCSICSAGSMPPKTAQNQAANRTLPPVGAAPLLTSEFLNKGRTLALTGAISAGWRCAEPGSQAPTRKTYCFSAVSTAPWQGGEIKSQLSIFPRPSGLTSAWAEPPKLELKGIRRTRLYAVRMDGRSADLDDLSPGNFETRMGDDCYILKMSDGVLQAQIDLLQEDGTPHPYLHLRPNRVGRHMFERLEEFALPSSCYQSVQIQVRLTFIPPPKPPPIERSFWNDFLPGGRPESNRRRF
jgi:hypothetical protein